jgi:hypothetical protein
MCIVWYLRVKRSVPAAKCATLAEQEPEQDRCRRVCDLAVDLMIMRAESVALLQLVAVQPLHSNQKTAALTRASRDMRQWRSRRATSF